MYLIVQTYLSIIGNTEWSQIYNAQACGHVQNMLDNLRTQLMQYTDQQKVAKQVVNSWN